jgi:hypothetical protein
MDYVRKFLEQIVIARASGEDFNVAAVRSHRGAIYIKVMMWRQCRMSTSKLWKERMSQPMVGPVMSATTKRHEYSLRRPKSKRSVIQA